jgi:hypothetical protein
VCFKANVRTCLIGPLLLLLVKGASSSGRSDIRLGFELDFRGTVVPFPELALVSTQPLTHWVPTTFSTGVKRSEHGAFSTEVKNEWSYGSNFPYSFVACTGPLPSFL